MTEDTEEFSQFSDSVACREYTLPRTKRLDSREHQNCARIGKLQPVAYKVNMEWKSELNL